MQVIPNKYLQTNLNRLDAGPGSLLKAQNVRIDGGRIRTRNGQRLLVPQDPFGIANVTGYGDMRARKIWFYNGKVWGLFQADSYSDVIAYFDTTIGNGQWLCHQFDYQGLPVDNASAPPQFTQSNRRLLFSTHKGIYASPKLSADDQLDAGASSIQTTLRPAGCPPALPFTSACTTIDTSSTYDANWLQDLSDVSYRHVWKFINANGAVNYGAVSDIKRLSNQSGSAAAVQLHIPIPIDIVNATQIARFSVEIYRTLSSTPAANGVSPDPGDQMFLAIQVRPSAADIALGYITVQDIISPAALQGPLYTNETAQGDSASRIRPPIAKTMADFAGCAWYGNVVNRWLTTFQLASVRDPSATTKITLKDKDIIVLADLAYEMSDSPTIQDNQVQIDTSSGYQNLFKRIRNTISNLHTKYNLNFNRPYFNLASKTGPDDITGRAYLEQISDGLVPSNFTPYIGLYRQSGWPSNAGDQPSPIIPTPLVSQISGRGFKITDMNCSGLGDPIVFTLDSAPDFSVGDTVNLARLPVYQDMSLAVGSQGDGLILFTPGQYVVSAIGSLDVQLTGVTGSSAFTRKIGTSPFATDWTSFGVMHCVLQQSTGLKSAAIGQQQKQLNRLMYSAYYEPQNAPALNYMDIGASDKPIIALKTLNKSLFVFKQDGLFRVSGSYQNFQVQQFDPDVIIAGPDLVDSMGGSLYCMTSRGVYRISQNQSQRISYQIQNQIQSIILKYRQQVYKCGFAVGHRQDNSVTFWLPEGSQSLPTVGFVFDGQGWTKRTDQANSACCGLDPDSSSSKYSLFTIKNLGSGWLTQQRKQHNGYDYADEQIILGTPTGTFSSDNLNFPVTSDSGSIGASNFPVGTVVVPNGDPKIRAVVTAAADVSPGVVNLTLTTIDPQYSLLNWSSVLSAVAYLPIYVQWQYNIHGSDDIESVKHYTQFMLVFQQPYFSVADVGFASDISPSVEWLTDNMKGFILKREDPSLWPILSSSDQVLADKSIKCLVARSKSRCSQLRASFRNRRAIEYISSYGHVIREQTGGTNIERNNS